MSDLDAIRAALEPRRVGADHRICPWCTEEEPLLGPQRMPTPSLRVILYPPRPRRERTAFRTSRIASSSASRFARSTAVS